MWCYTVCDLLFQVERAHEEVLRLRREAEVCLIFIINLLSRIDETK